MRGALIVGINDYSFQPLDGCVNDANDVAQLLAKHEDGDKNFECEVITSDKTSITRPSLRQKIQNLFSISGDIALFYFSGHGTENNLGGYIVTPDATKYDEGISVQEILQLANQSSSRERIIILDCCNSGHLGNAPGTDNMANIKEGVTILTASKGNQKSVEKYASGIFTSLLIDAMSGGAADVLGKVTIASIYSYIDNVLGFFEQRPLYKSHVTKLISVRNCAPMVDVKYIKELGELFTARDALHQLDPSYEGKIIFTTLQRCRAAGLVEPIPPQLHLYQAAMNSEPCRLTRLGKYYWDLVKKNRI